MLEKMMTLKDCSTFLQISVVTIRRMINNKQFCEVKRIGGQIRVLCSDFFAWIDKQEDKTIQYNKIKNQRFLNNINKFRKGGTNE